MTIGIVGGGLMGIAVGALLARRGLRVEIFEAEPEPGGLAGTLTLEDGTVVDRYYHTILFSDSELRRWCSELNLLDQLRFRETKMGFYYRGQIHSMNNVVEFLRFPPLGWLDRFRLGLTVVYAQFVQDWKTLESIDVENWLVGLSGRTTFDNIWRPMLHAKFDSGFETTPATYIWSRLVRMKSTRSGASQKEKAGYLVGGYATLIKAMAARIVEAGGAIHLGQAVEEVLIEDGAAHGLRVGGAVRQYEAIIVTTPLPAFRRMIPAAPADYKAFLEKTAYLGIVCPLMVLDRPLTGYWTLNITDDSIPFTGVIETTTYIDPQHVGGHHLVYLPKYTTPGSAWFDRSDDEIREIWLKNLQTMFPQFDRQWMRYFLIHRERYVEPLHRLNETHLIPAVETPVRKLYLANTAQIYPALTNGESAARQARIVAQTVLAGQQAFTT